MQKILVLLVDDDALFIDATCASLAFIDNFVIDRASSAQEALEKTNQTRYDVIVSDYSMPEYTGIDLLKMIRRSSDIPFILFTGQDDEKVVIDAINNGVDFYLKKGEDAEVLFITLAHMIRQGAYKKHSEENIRENERKYRDLFEKSSIATIISDPAGNLMDINQAGLSLFGISAPSDVAGHPLFHNLSVSEEILSRLQDGESIRYIAPLDFDVCSACHERSSHPGKKFLDISISSQTRSDGSIYGYYLQIVDITAQYQAEEALRKAGEQFGSAIKGTRAGIWDWKIDSGETTFNERWAEIIGYTLEEISPTNIDTWIRFSHPDDLKRSDEQIRKHAMEEIPFYECEVRMRHKDGSWVWIEARGLISERDSQGRPVRMTGTHIDITERKKNEEELLKRGRILETISDAASEMMSSLTHQTINNVVERLGVALGVSRAYFFLYHSGPDGRSLISQKFEWTSGGITPEIDNPILQNLDWQTLGYDQSAAILLQGGIISGVVSSFPADEQSLFIDQGIKSVLLVPIFSRNEFYGLIGFDDCITERQWSPVEIEALKIAAGLFGAATSRISAEQEIREREINFSSFFNTIDDFLFVLTPDGTIEMVNDTVVNRLGYSRGELLGKPFLFTNPEARRQEAADFTACLLDGTKPFCPVPLMTRSGIQIPVETRIIRGLWNGHEALFAVSKDVSAISLSEEKFKKAFHYSGALMTILTLDDGEILDVNEMFLRTIGYTREELIGKRSSDFRFFDNPEDITRIVRDLKEHGSSRNNELRIRKKDGTPLIGILLADLIQIQGRDALLAVINDITEINRLSNALLQSNKKLNLLSSITRHDILNQVQILLFEDALLDEMIPKDSPLREDLVRISKSVDTIHRQILFTHDYQDMGVSQPGWERVESVLMKVKDNQIFSQMEIEVTTGDLEIYADPMFSKVCFNLLENALRHGDHVTRIRVFFIRDPGILVFEDNGAGVLEAEKKKIFSRGFGKNTGLGLFLTAEILSITGLSICETGEEGKGARFEIHIPPNEFRFAD